MTRAFTEIAFTPAVRKIQHEQGVGDAYKKFMSPEAERKDRLGPAEAAFIAARDGFYQATVSQTGWPYVQFRGGPRGFLKVLDEAHIAYADFRGNRQYVSAGNISTDGRVSLILMDYPNRRRLKLWGRARLVSLEDDAPLAEAVVLKEYRAVPERAVVIEVAALDWNCPQHIPQRLTVEEMSKQLAPMKAELMRLQAENAELKAFLNKQ